VAATRNAEPAGVEHGDDLPIGIVVPALRLQAAVLELICYEAGGYPFSLGRETVVLFRFDREFGFEELS
jgi:hypothetical protein